MRQLMAYAMSALVMAAVAYAFAPRNPTALPATELHVDRVQVNDLIVNHDQLVAVGERGTILLSADNAASWQAAAIDAARGATLTAVTGVNDQVLVAVGHDGWIVRSEDAGKHWQEVRYDEELGEPLLGVWSSGDKHVVAFGSFGKFMQSDDAGRTWVELDINADGFHINGLEGGADGQQMLVGEQGLVMRSLDGGDTWQTLSPFYNGSLFGVVRLAPQRWVAYGMRGNVFVSNDNGDNWARIELPHANPLYGHVLLPDAAGVMLVGAGSSLVHLDMDGRLLQSTQRRGTGTLTSAVAPSQRVLLLGGERGVYQGEGSRLAAGH